jgi:hypothetical protein
VWLRDLPEQHGEVRAAGRDLTTSLISGGLLTLRPGETATFLKQWPHRTTAQVPFWSFVRLTPRVTQRGEPYLESDSVRFVATGSAQLFKTKGAEKLPQIRFTLVYRIF